MTLYLSEKYFVRQDIRLLGYVGENNSREITVQNYETEGADSYRLLIEYADGVAYELEILDGRVTLNASVFRLAGEVRLQLHALRKNGDTYEYVKKSNIFKADIKESITDKVAPIPTPEVAQSILDEIRNTSGGGGGTGTNGATFIPSVSEDGTLSWTNNGGLSNPQPVNIKGKDGEDGSDGADGYTPIKGTDYWTPDDIQAIHNYIDNQIGTANITLENALDGGAE